MSIHGWYAIGIKVFPRKFDAQWPKNNCFGD